MSLLDTINALCLERLGREPNLDKPQGFNDLIQWLKIYDQRKLHIKACDKWAARSLVPKEYLVPAKLGVTLKWNNCVMKCTHDSGSIRIASGPREVAEARLDLKTALSRSYGAEKGEWAYSLVKPKVFTEKLLARDITDYKFHCGMGKVRWCQVIRGRWSGETRETILDPKGKVLPMHMDQNMVHDPDDSAFPGSEAWKQLTALAEKLAEPWRYVRVDLYWTGKPWFGELTFWPLAGCYLTDDEPKFGKMLQLDLSEKMEPLVA